MMQLTSQQRTHHKISNAEINGTVSYHSLNSEEFYMIFPAHQIIFKSLSALTMHFLRRLINIIVRSNATERIHI